MFLRLYQCNETKFTELETEQEKPSSAPLHYKWRKGDTNDHHEKAKQR